MSVPPSTFKAVEHGQGARATREFPALREWASTCAAIEAGRHILLIRKGGIAEAEFEIETKSFLLLPTLFHQAHGAPPPVDQVEVRLLCELVATAEVPGNFPLADLAGFHAYEQEQLATRLRYKPEKPLTLLAIRPFKLATPFALSLNAIRPLCKSWQAIPTPENLAANPVETHPALAVLADKLSMLET